MKNYRVDKMMNISVLEEKREGKDVFKNFDITTYSKTRFGMFNGETKRVHIEFPNEYCGVFIDRFGKDISFWKVDDIHSSLAVDVAISNQFFGRIYALEKEVRVTEPEEVVEQMKKAIEEFAENYK